MALFSRVAVDGKWSVSGVREVKSNTVPTRSSQQASGITHQGLSLAPDPYPGPCDGVGPRLSGPEEATHHSCVQLHTGYIGIGSQGVRKEPNPVDFGIFVLTAGTDEPRCETTEYR
ncbi:unnamed protein product [Pleuronectes platessa]|uniref:Uncharacterized protein n=1 Tax=Pleuronectes platessa TaxID=8262 RepID=A0A9N7VCR3_PLEPL|nr:unnamed protein product [Pleuronectes platessa]